MAKKPEDMTEEELLARIYLLERVRARLVEFLVPFLPLIRGFYGALWYVFHGITLSALFLRDVCEKPLMLADYVKALRPLTREH